MTSSARSASASERHERVLVTTLTKRMAEDLADYLLELGIKVHYLHSEVQTIERVEILRDLRLGAYDVVVGINLLREGLDLPEVSLVAILDADKEGFLRSEQSLIQTMGRAARHVNGSRHHVRRPGDRLDEARDGRDEPPPRDPGEIQRGARHRPGQHRQGRARPDRFHARRRRGKGQGPAAARCPRTKLARLIRELEKQMKQAAQELEFEKAALLRDQIFELRQEMEDEKLPEWERVRQAR